MNVMYMLRCADDSLYTGWTNDLPKRLSAHEAGTASKYTRSKLPVTLVLAIDCESPTVARRLEALMKRRSRVEKEQLLRSETALLEWIKEKTDTEAKITLPPIRPIA